MKENSMDSDENLFNMVHTSELIRWQRRQEPLSSLVGQRAAVCIEQKNLRFCYFPTFPPNVLGFITAWAPFDELDGRSKWCWLGETGDQLTLGGQEAYRAVRSAKLFSASSELQFCDVLKARHNLLLTSDKIRNLERVCLIPQPATLPRSTAAGLDFADFL